MIESTKQRLGAVLTAVVCLAGCGLPPSTSEFDSSVDRIEVYYRDFDTLAPIHYSTDELVRSATFRAVVADRESIEDLQKLTLLNCRVDQEASKDQIDVYLLVRRYSAGKLVSTWEASRFHFYEWPGSGGPCKMDPADREALKTALADMASKEG